MKPSEILSKAADRVEPEGAWTRHAYGKSARGSKVKRVASASCFCAVGAIQAAAGNTRFVDDWNRGSPIYNAISHTEDAVGTWDLTTWNDSPKRTQAEVVSALRKAAELARAEGE